MIDNYNDWLAEYKKNKYNIWIKVLLSNDIEFYLTSYNQWSDDLKKYCKTHGVNIKKVSLQYKSNIVSIDTEDCDGVYLVRSILGYCGEKTRNTMTIGKLKNNFMYKHIFITPELIQQFEEKDELEKCFEKAIIYHHDKKTSEATVI